MGELSEIFQWKGEVEKGLPNWEESEKEHLGEELSDVLLYLIRLADVCGIDLGDAASKKIVKNASKFQKALLMINAASSNFVGQQKRRKKKNSLLWNSEFEIISISPVESN
ncbi:hypothetical protein Vadar_008933 [Vaccinium darrowii]|uniref:Uncharacterized protein n=1 Tax=Vaccinium darrowii TaxID=229202 RepID=A0ACB7YV35_9ERIC|nr:hypothetical protein Vadar_008933 [Vaccinium darrowii]